MTTRRKKASVVMLTDDGGSKNKAPTRAFLRPPGTAAVVSDSTVATNARAIYFVREDQRAAAAFFAMARRSLGSRFAALALPPFVPRFRRAAVAGASSAGLESFSRSPVAMATIDTASSFVSRGRLGGLGMIKRCHGRAAESSAPAYRPVSN
jgi:hypothetical protein